MQLGGRAHILKRDLKIGDKTFSSLDGVKKGDCVGNNYYNHTAQENYISIFGNTSRLTLKEASILATEILREVKRIKTNA